MTKDTKDIEETPTMWSDEEFVPFSDLPYDEMVDIPDFAPFKKSTKTINVTGYGFNNTIMKNNCYFCDKRADLILESGHPSCAKCQIQLFDKKD